MICLTEGPTYFPLCCEYTRSFPQGLCVHARALQSYCLHLRSALVAECELQDKVRCCWGAAEGLERRLGKDRNGHDGMHGHNF